MGVYKVFNKCSQEILDLFKIKSEEVLIDLDDDGEKSIISYSCNSDVIKWEKRSNRVIVSVKNTYKILYSLENITGIHVSNKSVNTHSVISIPESYEGENIDVIIKSGGMKVNSSIEDSIIISKNKDKMKIAAVVLTWVDIKKKPSVVYNVTISSNEEYLYISYSNRERLKQITFEPNKSYSNVIFSLWKNEIYYCCKSDNEVFIECYNFDTLSRNRIYTDYNIKGFYIFSTNKVLIHINDGQENLKIIDMSNRVEEIFLSTDEFFIRELSASKNLLAMCIEENNKKYIKVINKSKKEMFSKEGIYKNIYINENKKYILAIYKKNICRIYFENLEIETIMLNSKKILSYKVINEESILINCVEDEQSYIILKNLVNGRGKKIFECNGKIEDYSIDYAGKIICAYKENSTINTCVLNKEGTSDKIIGSDIKIFVKGR